MMEGMPKRVAVSGASGFLGSPLVQSLRGDGVEVVPLVRRTPRAGEIGWDPDEGRIDAAAFETIDGVVHLAGENVGGLWTKARKRRILQSREKGTRLIAETLARLSDRPRVLVSASGIGYYGDGGEEILREDHPAGDDFLAEVCIAWEGATEPARSAGVRVVNTRFAVVLNPSGGALGLMLPLFRLGLGSRLGDGRQWMSWVTRADAVSALRFALRHPTLRGPVNVTAPDPVRNAEFTRALGRAVGRPTFVAAPSFVLRLALGEMADVTLLTSQRAVPAALEAAGFTFEAPTIDRAFGGGLDDSM